MDLLLLASTGAFVLFVMITLFVKRKSIKAYFASVERKKEWARKRQEFLIQMNEGVNPFTGYQMISYSINGKRNEKAVMGYNIPLEDLNCKHKWRSFVKDELNHFIETLKSHEFKMLEINDCNGSKRVMKL